MKGSSCPQLHPLNPPLEATANELHFISLESNYFINEMIIGDYAPFPALTKRNGGNIRTKIRDVDRLHMPTLVNVEQKYCYLSGSVFIYITEVSVSGIQVLIRKAFK